jgi:thiol-disulfide isomerase/thioredoxin
MNIRCHMKDLSHLIAAISIIAISSNTLTAAPTYGQWTEQQLRSELPEVQLPALWFDSDAPNLQVDTWTTGTPITKFESGQVYIVEFWATWCGPCIQAFVHLSELKSQYNDKIQIIGVNVLDIQDGESQTARNDRVTRFVSQHKDAIDCAIAVEQGDTIGNEWLIAAGQYDVPISFIVNKHGRIAWFGHPDFIEEPVAQILSGNYNSGNHAEAAEEVYRVNQWFSHFGPMLHEDDPSKGFAFLSMFIENELSDEPNMLRSFSRKIVHSKKIKNIDYKVAIRAAVLACEATDWEFARNIESLAHVYSLAGEFDKAVETMHLAIKNARPDQLASFNKTLATYKTELHAR